MALPPTLAYNYSAEINDRFLYERYFMKRLAFCLMALIWCGLTAYAGEVEVEGLPNSLADVEPGEWASYAVPNGYIQKHTVTKVEGSGPDALVVVRVENIYEDEVVNVVEVEYKAGEVDNPLDIPDQPGVSLNLRRDNIPFKGTRLPVVIMTINANGENSEWYLSPEVSVYGLVRQITDGKVVFDLLDYY